jgi:hypothetical protein
MPLKSAFAATNAWQRDPVFNEIFQLPPIVDVIQQITSKNERIARFWSGAHGWASLDAAQLLSRSRLDRQVSLSRTLTLWVPPAACATAPDADGRLILGWANLGTLVEGTLKWFLSVYYEDYKKDINTIRSKVGDTKDPDGVTLEPLRQFFERSVWTASDKWAAWLADVQQRRNAIHAYKHRELGTLDALESGIRDYWEFLDDLDSRVPYPDGVYHP